MKSWLANLFAPSPGTGALLDTRPAAKRLQDVHFAEIVSAAAPVTWQARALSALRTFPAFDQAQCYGCVAFSMAKILGIMRFLKDGVFVIFSPADIYDRRTTKGAGDGEGMNATDPFAIAAEGVTLDALVPAQGLSEAQINALTVPGYAREVSSLFKLSNPKPIILPRDDIDAVASVIQQTGKGVMVWFYFTAGEWPVAVPTLNPANADVSEVSDRTLRHSVVAVDFLLYQGQKALMIEDSAHFGGLTRRIVTESFFATRNIFAAYPMNFQLVTVGPSAFPKHLFTRSLTFLVLDAQGKPLFPQIYAAQRNDVTALQGALQAMGFFPQNITSTGLYGAVTANAVYDWQVARSVAPRSELAALQGRNFGPASIEAMNQELSE
jgi:hypothetical protein